MMLHMKYDSTIEMRSWQPRKIMSDQNKINYMTIKMGLWTTQFFFVNNQEIIN